MVICSLDALKKKGDEERNEKKKGNSRGVTTS